MMKLPSPRSRGMAIIGCNGKMGHEKEPTDLAKGQPARCDWCASSEVAKNASQPWKNPVTVGCFVTMLWTHLMTLGNSGLASAALRSRTILRSCAEIAPT
jgi:hypothetical protein